MRIVKYTIVSLLCMWVIMTTITTAQMTHDYKWQAWALVTFTPVAVAAGLWEFWNKVMKR